MTEAFRGIRGEMVHVAELVLAEEALQRLREGNARFASGRARFATVQKEVLKELAKGQQPYATILGCSDSRVPPERQGVGYVPLENFVGRAEIIFFSVDEGASAWQFWKWPWTVRPERIFKLL